MASLSSPSGILIPRMLDVFSHYAILSYRHFCVFYHFIRLGFSLKIFLQNYLSFHEFEQGAQVLAASSMVCKVLTTAAFAHRFAVTTLRPRAHDQLRRGPRPGKRAVKAGQHRLVHPAPHGQGSLRAWRCHHEGRLSKRGARDGTGTVLIKHSPFYFKNTPNHTNILVSTLEEIWKEVQQKLTWLPQRP